MKMNSTDLVIECNAPEQAKDSKEDSQGVGLPKFNLQLFEYRHNDPHVYGVAMSAKNKVTISPMGSHAKSILKRALIGVDDSRWLGGRVHGLLDANDLVRAYQGEDDVYRQRTKDPELDTAVTLLIDMSGSMKGERIEWATKTALMLGDALDSLGVPLEILGHTTMALHNYALYPKGDVDQVFEFANTNRHPELAQFKFQNADQTGKRLKGGRSGKVVERLAIKAYERYVLGHSLSAEEVHALGCALTSAPRYISSDPLVMFNLLGFGVRVRNARDVIERLPYLVGVYGENNIDSRAIEFAVNRIKVCKQKRKIILMLCDGIPYARGMLSKSLNQCTVAATIEAQKQDVTIIAIGFGESKVAEFFHNHVALVSIGQMEDVVLSVVKKVLRASQTGSKCTMVGGAGMRV
jgi:Cobalamin biosynthesis protein CobT VWA domain